jgi:hypothetical protein
MDSSRVACARCHLKLSHVTGPRGADWWGHPIKSDHEEIPVELPLADIIRVCDFCLALRPQWVIPLMEHADTTGWEPDFRLNVTALDTDGWWMACDACLAFISKSERKGLRDRALGVLTVNLGSPATPSEKERLLLQLAAFWRAQPGPAVEASLLDD